MVVGEKGARLAWMGKVVGVWGKDVISDPFRKTSGWGGAKQIIEKDTSLINFDFICHEHRLTHSHRWAVAN